MWAAFGAFAGRGVQFFIDIILSYYLVPNQIGILAVGLAILNITEMLTDTGFFSALIQRKDKIIDQLDTAWTLELLKSIALCILIYSSSNIIAIFYNEPQTASLIKSISFLFVFRGLRNIGVVYFKRELNLKKQFFFDSIPFLFQLLFICIFAFYRKDYWLAIIGIYGRRIGELGLSYLLDDYRPKFRINKNTINDLFNFGKWIFLISVVSAFVNNFAQLFIGKFSNFEILGFYTRGYLISFAGFSLISQIFWNVLYPTISRLQGNSKKISQLFSNIQAILFFYGIPLTATFSLFANEIIVAILSNKWLDSIYFAQYLFIAGFVSLLNTVNHILMQSIGLPKFSFQISLFYLIILIPSIFIIYEFIGVLGIPFAIISSELATLILGWVLVTKFIEMKFLRILKSFTFFTFTGTLVFIPIIFIKNNILSAIHNSIQIFVTVFLLLLITFSTVIWGLKLFSNKTYLNLINPFRGV